MVIASKGLLPPTYGNRVSRRLEAAESGGELDYGRAVRIVRASRGVSQKELAEKAGLKPSYISLIESGQRTPSVSTIGKLCAALKVPNSLLTLLASGSDELRNIDPTTAGVLGTEILHLLMEVEKEQDDGC